MFAVYAKEANAEDPLSSIVVDERPEPKVPEGWVRVKVSHASLNRHDFSARTYTSLGIGDSVNTYLPNDGQEIPLPYSSTGHSAETDASAGTIPLPGPEAPTAPEALPDDGQGPLASFQPGQFPGLDRSFSQDHSSLFGGDPFGLRTATGEKTQPPEILGSNPLMSEPIANIEPHQFGTDDFGTAPIPPIESGLDDNMAMTQIEIPPPPPLPPPPPPREPDPPMSIGGSSMGESSMSNFEPSAQPMEAFAPAEQEGGGTTESGGGEVEA
jgi:hypothetical protein